MKLQTFAAAVLVLPGFVLQAQTDVTGAVADALETTNLVWITDSAHPWAATTKYSSDGEDAAQSGAITDGGETWIETEVAGPAVIDFAWRVWSEPDFDFLELWADGVLVQDLSGDSGWQQVSLGVVSGDHTLRWRYVKDLSDSLGLDRGWLDQVRVRPVLPPEIAQSPESQTVFRGETVTWSVAAESLAPLSFQWRRGLQDLPDATNATLVLPDVQPVDSGEYTVVLSNVAGSVTNPPVRLTVLPLTGRVGYFTDFGPTFTGPSGPILEAGLTPVAITNLGTVDLNALDILMINELADDQVSSVVRANLPTIETWVLRGGKLMIHDHSGGTLNPSPLLMGGTNISLTRSFGSDINRAIPSDTLVTAGPAGGLTDTSLDQGNASFHGYALGSTLPFGSRKILQAGSQTNEVVGFSYPLYRGLVYYAALPLAYRLEDAFASDPFSRNLREIYTPNVLAYLLAAGQFAAPPAIYQQPPDRSTLEGDTLSLRVAATGTPPFAYQWWREGNRLEGATGPVLTLTNLTSDQTGGYAVVITNLYGAATSRVASVTLRPPPRVTLFFDPDYVQTQGSVEAEALNLQATLGFLGFPVVTNASLSTAPGSSLLWIPEQEAGDLGAGLTPELRLATTNWIAAGGTLVIHGTTLGRAASFLNGLLGSALVEGGSWESQPLRRTAAAAGTEFADDPLILPIPESTAGLTAASLPPGWEAYYHAGERVGVARLALGAGQILYLGWDGYGAVPRGWQDEGWLEVFQSAAMSAGPIPPTAPVVTRQPADRRALEGGTAELAVEAYGSVPLHYQWFGGAIPLAGGTNATLRLTDISTNDAGPYHVLISNVHGTATSSNAVLTVLPADQEEFRIVSLGVNGSAVVDHDFLTGDDHGGIAVSGSSVWVTGDSATARFNLRDLGGGTGLAAVFNTLVSDLRTETTYVLGDGTTPVWGGATATSLIEMDDRTGQPTRNTVPLSQSIQLDSPGGLFAGYGRVVLWINQRVYDIRLPAGEVRDLGTLSLGQYQGSESWAIWGVAEYFEDALHLVYVQDSLTIVRRSVPDGTLSVVGQFDYLADMASFTVSPSLGRWYFHHEGGSQFGGSSETVGYADATFEFSLPAAPPVIRAPPRDYLAAVGGSARFSVRAGGTRPLTYQWRHDGAPLLGATNASLPLTTLRPEDAGQYSVVVSNAFGVAVSPNALLTLRTGVVASVFDHPGFVDSSGASGAESDQVQAALRSLGVDVRPVLGFEGGLAGGVLVIPELETGDLAPTLTLSSQLVLSNWTARGGTLIVHGGTSGRAGTLLNRVFQRSFSESGTVDPSVILSRNPASGLFGDGPEALPILADSTAFWTWDLAAESEAVYRAFDIAAVAQIEVGLGRVIFLGWDWSDADLSGEAGGGWTDVLRLAVLGSGPVQPVPPALVLQPRDALVTEGRTVRWSVGALGDPPLAYQWWHENEELAGATNASFTLSNVTTNDVGRYRVVVTNPHGSVASSNAVLTLRPGTGTGEFQILALRTDGSTVQDHDAYTGDDRGGIAVSDSHVFVTGDSGTARLTRDNLSDTASLGGHPRDTLISDLSTDTVYLLGNGANDQVLGGSATTLIELDGATGQPTGSLLQLSEPIPSLQAPAGLFSGYGRVVVWNNGHVYDIELPSGTVEDLGVLSLDTYMGSESWAIWGVAEFFDDAVHLVYVQDPQTIVRRRVPDGALSEVARFSNLGDMASLTVSVPLNRWYFHHEGGSQFGGSYETVGYAAAEFSVLTPNTPPAIVRQPHDLVAIPDSTAVLSVQARGSVPLTYQWWHDGTPVEGATQEILTLNPVTAADAGLYHVVVGNAFGSVTSTPARLTVQPLGLEEFYIVSLGTNATVIGHDAVTGDDRGGIAASTTRLLVTGDAATAQFDLEDLTGGLSLGTVLDSLVTDLKTATVYVLGNGTVPVGEGQTASSLIELDDETGAPTGQITPLSMGIPLVRPGGVFSGYGQAAVLSGGRIYSITLPLGVVRDLGPFNLVTQLLSESWAVWGLAEYFNDALYLVYVQDQQTIVRRRVPDGEVSVVGRFSYLGELASFTASVELGRWYFHYENGAQFGGGGETAGFADARFSVVPEPVPPVIRTAPVSITVLPGDGFTLSVSATGSRPLTYQWYLGGEAVPGATNASWTLTHALRPQLGDYRVVVSNPYGSVTSAPATISFPPPAQLVAYHTDGRPESPGPEASIEHTGLVPWRREQLEAADLDLARMLLLNVSGNDGPSEALQEVLPTLRPWIESGGRLIIHDRGVGHGPDPSPLLLGAEGVSLVRWNGVDLEPLGTNPVVNGPYGTLGGASLDDGWDSFHGYAEAATLPVAAERILVVGSGSDQSRIAAFRYPLGRGHIYYSTIPLDFYLEDVGPEPLTSVLRMTYTPNVLAYMQALVEVPPPGLSWERRSDGRLELEWPIGALQSAPSVDGPWDNLPAQRSPYRFDATEAQRFYRVVQ